MFRLDRTPDQGVRIERDGFSLTRRRRRPVKFILNTLLASAAVSKCLFNATVIVANILSSFFLFLSIIKTEKIGA